LPSVASKSSGRSDEGASSESVVVSDVSSAASLESSGEDPSSDSWLSAAFCSSD
jgi:hypothetical protein